jgi:iron complex outermembrane receptor protein
MKSFASLALAGVSTLAISSAASAQSAPAQPAAAPAQEVSLGEIVVTARRRSESLQEVPQTVNAVTSETLQKLNIRQFADIQTVAPGLNLSQSNTGFQNTAALRGVSYDVNTGAQIATVATYLNDAPMPLNVVFQSMFDIGQVEILKGPQGTTRGVSSPSGAITITTHKPDLSEFGGYADVTLTDSHGRNAQGALNIPIIKDVLAVRVAGLIDNNQGDGVRSIHSAVRPHANTDALRASVSFEPSDTFNANVSYQHLDQDLVNFGQVTGAGPGAFTIGTTAFPASVNPPLSTEDRAAVMDLPNHARNHIDYVTAQVDSRVFGQHLSYIGSYSIQKINVEEESDHPSFGDVGNVLPGIGILEHPMTRSVNTTQEFRLASEPAPGRFFDYTVGAYYSWQGVTGDIIQPGPLFPGAFGPTTAVNLAAFNPAYSIPLTINIPRGTQETSVFGSVTLHLTSNTELSGGIRHIWAVDSNNTIVGVGNALLNLGALGLPTSLPCSILPGGSAGPGPGDCILNTASSSANHFHSSDTPNIYNVSLSHHFTRDFLAYVNTGTSYRGSTSSVGIQGDLFNNPDPQLNTLTNHPAERSRSYEIGFKSTWLDGRARLNAAVYRQRFHNLTVYIPHVAYYNTTTGGDTLFDFTTSVDALVQGFDVDGAFQITPEWNVSAQMSYAHGQIEGSLVPCNSGTLSPTNLVSFCPGGSSSRLPLWNMSIQSEYVRPVRDNVDGFVQVLATIYPENKYAEANFAVPNYALLNLYAGVRSHDGAWTASIFARNVLNTVVALDRSPVQADLSGSLGTLAAEFGGVNPAFATLNRKSGYYETLTNTPREVGINVRYAFGSR